MICRNCKRKKFEKICDIGYQPISSLFLKKKIKIKNYSLDLFKCNFCDLVQLSKIPNLKDMYGLNYGYKTSVSKLMVNHLKEKISKLNKFSIFKKGSKILDIGSNDGTFLNFFLKFNKKFDLFGIDPSASAFIENYNKRINVIIDFLIKKTLKIISLKRYKIFIDNLLCYVL